MAVDPFARADFLEFVNDVKLGVVATFDRDRGPEAALVDLAATDEGDLLFDSWGTARKVRNLGADPRVAVVVSAGEVTMQAEGVAEILDGESREAYGRIYRERLPGAHALTEGFALILVRLGWARRYEATGGKPDIKESSWA